MRILDDLGGLGFAGSFEPFGAAEARVVDPAGRTLLIPVDTLIAMIRELGGASVLALLCLIRDAELTSEPDTSDASDAPTGTAPARRSLRLPHWNAEHLRQATGLGRDQAYAAASTLRRVGLLSTVRAATPGTGARGGQHAYLTGIAGVSAPTAPPAVRGRARAGVSPVSGNSGNRGNRKADPGVPPVSGSPGDREPSARTSSSEPISWDPGDRDLTQTVSPNRSHEDSSTVPAEHRPAAVPAEQGSRGGETRAASGWPVTADLEALAVLACRAPERAQELLRARLADKPKRLPAVCSLLAVEAGPTDRAAKLAAWLVGALRAPGEHGLRTREFIELVEHVGKCGVALPAQLPAPAELVTRLVASILAGCLGTTEIRAWGGYLNRGLHRAAGQWSSAGLRWLTKDVERLSAQLLAEADQGGRPDPDAEAAGSEPAGAASADLPAAHVQTAVPADSLRVPSPTEPSPTQPSPRPDPGVAADEPAAVLGRTWDSAAAARVVLELPLEVAFTLVRDLSVDAGQDVSWMRVNRGCVRAAVSVLNAAHPHLVLAGVEQAQAWLHRAREAGAGHELAG